MNTIRQGDVLLVPITEIPVATRKRKSENGRRILARGEATGHHHSVVADAHTDLLELPGQDELYLLVKEGNALLEHQEHAALVVPPGRYKVVIQREYAPASPTLSQRVLD